jgi:hypothetical protein
MGKPLVRPPIGINAPFRFGPFECREFYMTHVIPSARLAGLYATSSDVASYLRRRRADLLDRIRQLARGLAEILRLPARSVVDLCLRSQMSRPAPLLNDDDPGH